MFRKQCISFKNGIRGKPFRGGLISLFSHSLMVCFVGLLLGMCESVRTRNTLYEVGARKSKICYNAVERRKEKKEKKRKKIKIEIINIKKYYKIKIFKITKKCS